MHFLIKVLLVLLKYLFPDFELLIDILLLIIDERGIIMKIVLSKWLKRVLVVGVTIVAYNIDQERSVIRGSNPQPTTNLCNFKEDYLLFLWFINTKF